MGKTSKKEPSLVYFQSVLDFRGGPQRLRMKMDISYCGSLFPGAFLVLAFEDMPENFHPLELATKCEGKGEKVELEEGTRKSSVR